MAAFLSNLAAVLVGSSLFISLLVYIYTKRAQINRRRRTSQQLVVCDTFQKTTAR